MLIFTENTLKTTEKQLSLSRTQKEIIYSNFPLSWNVSCPAMFRSQIRGTMPWVTTLNEDIKLVRITSLKSNHQDLIFRLQKEIKPASE